MSSGAGSGLRIYRLVCRFIELVDEVFIGHSAYYYAIRCVQLDVSRVRRLKQV